MTPEVAAKAIAEGKIDGMGVARQFLTDPEWVTKLMQDREDDIMPCICCHNACFNMAHYNGVPNDQDLSDTAGMARCALNPHTMQSKKYKIVPATKSKKIAVIGGGIGGMEVARVATLRGHKVTIYEKATTSAASSSLRLLRLSRKRTKNLSNGTKNKSKIWASK